MQANHITLRHATHNDLEDINQVVEQAVLTWNLPARVQRLVLPSYRYSSLDLAHMQFIVATQPSAQIIGVAAWEQAELSDTPEGERGLLLHGLYVLPERRTQGLGSLLLESVEQTGTEQQMAGVLIKAHADAVSFFVLKGYRQLPAKNPARDFENRFWKRLPA